MTPTLADQYRRWFEYEKDSHRKVLESLGDRPGGRASVGALPEGAEPHGPPRRGAADVAAPAGTDVRAARGHLPHGRAARGPAGRIRGHRARLDRLPRVADRSRTCERVFTYRTTEGNWYRTALGDILTQLYGHSHYHRGQIASLVRRRRPAGDDGLHLLGPRAGRAAGSPDRTSPRAAPRVAIRLQLRHDHGMDIQPGHDHARPAGRRLDLQVAALGLEVDPSQAILRRERDPDVVDRHDLLAQRHVVVREGMEGRRC